MLAALEPIGGGMAFFWFVAGEKRRARPTEMDQTRFVVEGSLASRGIVLCRRLDEKDFTLTSASTLAGRPVKGFDIPRKVSPDGSLARDAFGFFLTNPEDARLFRVGEEVVLENP